MPSWVDDAIFAAQNRGKTDAELALEAAEKRFGPQPKQVNLEELIKKQQAEEQKRKEFYARPEMQGPAGAVFEAVSGGEVPVDPRTETSGERGRRVAGVVGRAMDPLGTTAETLARKGGASPGTQAAVSLGTGLLMPDPTDLLKAGTKGAGAADELVELADDLVRRSVPDAGGSVKSDKGILAMLGEAQALEPKAQEMNRLAYKQYEQLGGEAGPAIKEARRGTAPTAAVEPGSVSGVASYDPRADVVRYGSETLQGAEPKVARATTKHEVGHAVSEKLRERSPMTTSAIENEYEAMQGIRARKNIDKFKEISDELYGRPGDLANIKRMAQVREMEAAQRGASFEQVYFGKLASDLDALEKSGKKGGLKKTLDSWQEQAKKFSTRRFEDVEGLLEREQMAKGEQMHVPQARVLQKTKEAARAVPYRAPESPIHDPSMSRLRHGSDEDIADLLALSIEDPRYLRQELGAMRPGGVSREALQKYMDEISSQSGGDPLAELANELNIRLK